MKNSILVIVVIIIISAVAFIKEFNKKSAKQKAKDDVEVLLKSIRDSADLKRKKTDSLLRIINGR